MTAVAEHTALGELVNIRDLVPSPLNPRSLFDEVKLKELAASITSKGIIEPLIVRQRAGLGQLEIVAGERRYRAAKLAGLQELPVIIRTLTDVEVLELMAIENLQRDDLHPLDEAEGYVALRKADPAYTPKAIAAKIGKSERYVHQRLQLARLEKPVKQAFLKNSITAGHADLISRLTSDDQVRALKVCFDNLYGDDAERGCCSVRQLNRWIEQSIRLPLDAADPQTELFPEVAKVLETPEAAAKILQISTQYVQPSQRESVLGAVLSTELYRQVASKKDRCKHAQRAVVVLGHGRGTFVEVCTAKTECKTHWKYEIETAAARQNTTKATTPAQKAKASKGPSAAAKQQKGKHERDENIRRIRREAIQIATKQIGKLKIKPGPPVLAILKAKSWTELVADATADLFVFRPADWKKAVALLKPFGVKLESIAAGLQTSAITKKGRAA